MTLELTDAELLSAYRSGSEAAFQELYFRRRDKLYLYARALTRDDGAAEDLVHETFLKVIRSNPSSPPTGSLNAFFHTVLRRLAIDKARSERASRQREHQSSLRWVRSLDPGIEPEMLDELNRALPTLPSEQLEVVLLHHYSGLTFEETSDTGARPDSRRPGRRGRRKGRGGRSTPGKRGSSGSLGLNG